jgi:DNA-directed RNA polymerase subunit F
LIYYGNKKNNDMTELLEKAIAELKKLTDTQQNEVAMMILKQIQPQAQDKLSSLWQRVDELGTDEEQPTKSEITTIVKKVRHSKN